MNFSGLSVRSTPEIRGCPDLLPRLDLQHRPVILVREQIQQPVRPLPHIPNALVQIREQRFPPLLAVLD